MTTFFYSVLHFLVDGICAAAMFSRFLGGSRGYWWILAYNFCAFVLQMPFGAVLDGWNGSGESAGQRKAFAFAAAGVALTIVGAFTSPVILGIGNALFHVGGGVGTILEDRECGSAGRRLGVFVAPGAMGLFLGKVAAQSGSAGNALAMQYGSGEAILGALSGSFGASFNAVVALNPGTLWVIGSAAAAFMMIALLWRALGSRETPRDIALIYAPPQSFHSKSHEILIIAGCFCVVVLRSYVGMAVTMPWRITVLAGLIATAAVVLGKIAGGFLAASVGRRRTVLWSLLAAAVCYVFCDKAAAGIPAVLFFNMTMPVTLQILVDRYRELPGTMFGLLTVGLFIGFLPVYFAVDVVGAVSMAGAVDAVDAVGVIGMIGVSVSGGVVGAVLSLASLALLWVVGGDDRLEGAKADVGEGVKDDAGEGVKVSIGKGARVDIENRPQCHRGDIENRPQCQGS